MLIPEGAHSLMEETETKPMTDRVQWEQKRNGI